MTKKREARDFSELRPGMVVSAELVGQLVCDIFAAIAGERFEKEQYELDEAHNHAIDTALSAAGDVVKRHGMTIERGTTK